MSDELTAEVGASLRLQIGQQTSVLQRLAQAIERQSEMPRYLSVSGTATADASGWAAIQLGPVAQGQRWVVHNVAAGGILWSTPAAGAAAWAVSPSPPTPDEGPPTAQVRWAAATLPYGETFSRGPLVVPPMQSLWVVITGATAGQLYAATATFVAERADS